VGHDLHCALHQVAFFTLAAWLGKPADAIYEPKELAKTMKA
jgi:hypothetical protein